MYLGLQVYDILDKMKLYLQIHFSHQYAAVGETHVPNFFQEIQQTFGLSILLKQKVKILKPYKIIHGHMDVRT